MLLPWVPEVFRTPRAGAETRLVPMPPPPVVQPQLSESGIPLEAIVERCPGTGMLTAATECEL